MSVGDDAESGNGVGDEHAPQRDAPFAAGVVQSRLGRQQNPVAHVPDQEGKYGCAQTRKNEFGLAK